MKLTQHHLFLPSIVSSPESVFVPSLEHLDRLHNYFFLELICTILREFFQQELPGHKNSYFSLSISIFFFPYSTLLASFYFFAVLCQKILWFKVMHLNQRQLHHWCQGTKAGVLVCQGCYNKIPQTYFCIVLKSKIRCQQVWFLLRTDSSTCRWSSSHLTCRQPLTRSFFCVYASLAFMYSNLFS